MEYIKNPMMIEEKSFIMIQEIIDEIRPGYKFKNEIEVGKKDNDELLAELCRAIQVLAVRNLSKGKSLSSGVSDLSKMLTEFQEKSERNFNLARGLTSLGSLSFK